MTIDRRRLLTAGAAVASAGIASAAMAIRAPFAEGRGDEEKRSAVLKPARLAAGDRVALVNPATAAFEREEIEIATESLELMGLEVVHGDNYFNRRGYFAGSDEERAADIMRFFEDSKVKALWARGGWGSARVLPHLDYEVIRRNPKVLIGFSDVTALLLAIHARTGLVTFHGPFPRRQLIADTQRELLFDAASPRLATPTEPEGDALVQLEGRIRTIRSGKARGRLIGGNLTVLSAIVGSGYLPDFDGAILFLEDLNEAVYRVDRMITQLSLAGILERVSAVVFGHCSRCPASTDFGSLTMEEVLEDHFADLGVPAFSGALIGHIKNQFTLPLGIEAEVDADTGVIQLLEAAVT
jgi:muramoyltetrapeptide carboxypeptidase